MSRIAQLLVALALVAVFAASAVSAFKCKKCIPDAGSKKDCQDPIDYEDETCTGEKPYCRRMVQNVEGKVSLVLQCAAAEGGLVKPYYNTANDYVKANVYHCYEELCNSASDIGASKLAAVVVVALAWMLH